MSIQPATQERSSRSTFPVWVGLALVLASIVLLFSPVSVSSFGLTASCGTAIAQEIDTSPTDAFYSSKSGAELGITTWAHKGPSTGKLCIDALTIRRSLAWPALVGGGVLLGVFWLRRGTAATKATVVSDARASTGERSRALRFPPARYGAADPIATQGTSATPPGWYPDQNDPALVRWFDGSDWTKATLSRTESESPATPNSNRIERRGEGHAE